MNYKEQKTKTLKIKVNGRSSDFVTPNFILGCEGGCSYCYTYRWNRPSIYFNTNTDEILNKILLHSKTAKVCKPNQVDSKFTTYDIGCSTDLSLYWNKYPFKKVLKFFRKNNIKSTFATKFVNMNMLKEAEANNQNRIRFSIMPQVIADIVQPKVTKELTKIKAIDKAINLGWNVHINFSPVIYYNGWKEDYRELFKLIDKHVTYKDKVKCEVIFLTHHKGLHERNMQNNLEGEEILWNPEIQENKVSNYGGNNIRYQYQLKRIFIEEFKQLHNKYIPWCSIRYIF